MLKIKSRWFRDIIMSIGVGLCLISLPSISVAAETTIDYSANVDAGIGKLDYNKYEVLANQGDVVENITPREGTLQAGKFIVLQHKKVSLGSEPIDISVVDSIIDRTYPGALLLADKEFTKNRPTALVVDRDPIAISIDLPGLDENTVVVDDPTFGNVNNAINTLVDRWSDENSATHTLPARTQYNEMMAYSKTQLSMGLNVDIKVADQLLGIDFDSIAKGEKKYMVASYKQIFYTVSAEMPKKPSDLFASNVSFKDLKYKGVSQDAPPLLVNNVAYGRSIYVVLQTESRSAQVESAFKALIKGQNIEANAEFKQIINNSSFQVVVLGGDAREHNRLITTDFEEIRRIIKENAEFGINNPGYPISYTSSFVKDNALAAVHNKTDYVETTATEYNQAKVTLDHRGAYIAQFAVNWEEFNYDSKGNEIVTKRSWSGNDVDKTAHYSTVINIPANSRNLSILARECTGLAWEWWRTVIDERNVPLSGNIKASIWGTTLHPAFKMEYN